MNECLIDFEPFPKCPRWYDDGDTSSWDWNTLDTFRKVYDRAKDIRLGVRKFLLREAMCERLLSADEEVEAHNFGCELTNGDYKLLSDLWFQQRRLKALEQGKFLS